MKSITQHLESVTAAKLSEWRDSHFLAFASSTSPNGHIEIGAYGSAYGVKTSDGKIHSFTSPSSAVKFYGKMLGE